MNGSAAVAMEITELDVNDSTLTLSYNITNGTDRDAWVCSRIASYRIGTDRGVPLYSSITSSVPFEVYLTSDKPTLLIRKRLDVPTTMMWDPGPPAGTYVRIAPGASLVDSVRIAVPVSPRLIYASREATLLAQTATRLALEIGYYDRDLPAMIRSIIAVAEKSGLAINDVPWDILNTYFRGVAVQALLRDFDRENTDPYGQGQVLIRYTSQALTGEKVLRVDVNGVSIPYRGYSEGLAGTP